MYNVYILNGQLVLDAILEPKPDIKHLYQF